MALACDASAWAAALVVWERLRLGASSPVMIGEGHRMCCIRAPKRQRRAMLLSRRVRPADSFSALHQTNASLRVDSKSATSSGMHMAGKG